MKDFKSKSWSSLGNSQQNISNGFEDVFEESLAKNKFQKIDKDKEIAEIKSDVKDVLNEDYPKNHKNFDWYIAQPYGSQSYPDFLVGYKDKIYPIELKSVKSKSNPFWNGHVITTKGIYVFGSYETNEVTFALGKDLTSKENKELVLKKLKLLREIVDEIKASNSSSEDEGQEIYFRQTLQQPKSKPLYSHPKRKSREENVMKLW